jgi:PAS domain S-box-containing protein
MPSRTRTFEGLLEAVPDAMVGVDNAGVIRLVNHQAESLFGYEQNGLVGAPLETLVPESLRRVHATHREGYNTAPRTRPMGTDLTLTGLRRDGTEFPVDIALSPMGSGDDMLVIAAVRDMTNREKANRERDLMSRRLSVIEFSAEAIVSTSVDGVITSWNPGAERLYGYSSEEVMGKSVRFLIPDDRADEMKAISTKLKAGQPVQHLDTMRVRKDGTLFSATVTVSPIREKDGEIIGASSSFRDVTEQKQALEAAQRMAAIVEYSNDAIFGCMLDGTITSWNPAAERLYGYSSKEIIGKLAKTMTPKDRVGEMKAILDQITAGQRVEDFETNRVRKDGTVVPVSLTISPIRDADGEVIGTSVIHRDVTEHRELLAAAERVAAIVEHSYDAIIGETLDGIITGWNPAAERLYGYSSKDVVGKSFDLLVPKDRSGETKAILAIIKAGEYVEHHETNRVRKDGRVLPVSLTISPIRDADTTIVGASVIAHDVTEQRQSLVAAQRMAAIIESSDDAIASSTLEGIVMTWNPAYERLSGYCSEEVIGKSGGFLGPKDRIHEMNAIVARIVAGEHVGDFETIVVRKDGTVVPVSMNLSPIRDAYGTIMGLSTIVHDLTKQREASELARAMIEASMDSMVSISPEGKITDANEATVIMTGVPRDKLIGTSFSEYFTDPEKAEEIYQRVFEQGPITDYPLTLRHHGEQEILTDVLYNASVYRDPRGKVSRVFAAARDVTEQMQVQRERAEQQAREQDRLAELERFQRLTVGRELRMIELKKEIEYLKKHGPGTQGTTGPDPGDQH